MGRERWGHNQQNTTLVSCRAESWPSCAEHGRQSRGSPDIHRASLAAGLQFGSTTRAADWRIESLPEAAGSFLGGWRSTQEAGTFDYSGHIIGEWRFNRSGRR